MLVLWQHAGTLTLPGPGDLPPCRELPSLGALPHHLLGLLAKELHGTCMAAWSPMLLPGSFASTSLCVRKGASWQACLTPLFALIGAPCAPSWGKPELQLHITSDACTLCQSLQASTTAGQAQLTGPPSM